VWRAATPRDFEGGVAKQGGRCRRRAPLRSAELHALERELDPASMRFSVLSKNLIMDAVAAQRAPWVHILDAYSIARQRADAHPGPDPKTNRHGSLHPRAYDDCLHYCLPGVPDLYNGRLLALLTRAANDATSPSSHRAAPEETVAAATRATASGASVDGAAGGTPPALAEGAPGALLARWNFAFAGRPFVYGALDRGGLSLHLDRHSPPTALECPLPLARGGRYPPTDANEPRAAPPLLGFCAALDPPASFRRGNTTRGGGSSRRYSELKTEVGKARRATLSSLLSRKERDSLRSTRRNASSSGGVLSRILG
jgi:hypothetical protein